MNATLTINCSMCGKLIAEMQGLDSTHDLTLSAIRNRLDDGETGAVVEENDMQIDIYCCAKCAE